MASELKTLMVSVRLPASVVERLDYVARNNDTGLRNRSEAVEAAIAAWLPRQEERLKTLGLDPPAPKKAP